MIPFELQEPKTLREALALLDPEDPTVRPIAGGTALMLMMKSRVFEPARLVSLRSVEKTYSSVTRSADGTLRIGALTSLAAMERSAEVRQHAPVITTTLKTLSNIRVRNVATLGGALAHGDPHMDLPPLLIALGAIVTVTGPKRERTIALEDLFAGYYETTLARDELITEALVPSMQGKRASYMKVTTRAAHDWPALGVAVALGGDGARIVISAATEKAMRLPEAEAALEGAEDAAAFRRAGDAAADTAELMSDAQGSAAYKKQLVRVYVERALKAAASGQGGH
jgi:carbon-monoxide dehydrogenase medium subunit